MESRQVCSRQVNSRLVCRLQQSDRHPVWDDKLRHSWARSLQTSVPSGRGHRRPQLTSLTPLWGTMSMLASLRRQRQLQLTRRSCQWGSSQLPHYSGLIAWTISRLTRPRSSIQISSRISPYRDQMRRAANGAWISRTHPIPMQQPRSYLWDHPLAQAPRMLNRSSRVYQPQTHGQYSRG